MPDTVVAGQSMPLETMASPPSVERLRAMATARALLRSPNIDSRSDLAVLAREFLLAIGAE